jgi:hypothetical protein
MSIPAWACTIAGMLLVVLGGLWLAVRLLRGDAVSRDESGARRLPNAPDGIPGAPGRVLRFKGPLVHDTFARADDGTLWRWDGTRWVEHIEDLPTPRERRKRDA